MKYIVIVNSYIIYILYATGYIHKQSAGRLGGSLKGTTLGGFVSSNIYLGTPTDPDSTCRTPSLISGVAVGHCKEQDGFWYKFHLTKGNTTYTPTTPLPIVTTAHLTPPHTQQIAAMVLLWSTTKTSNVLTFLASVSWALR